MERIETERDYSVTLWHLVNLALVLDCDLYDLIEDDWLSYRRVDMTVPEPGRKALNRPPGAQDPAAGRERARRRPPVR